MAANRAAQQRPPDAVASQKRGREAGCSETMGILADGAARVHETDYQGLEPVLGVELSLQEGLVRRLSEARPELVQVDQLEQDGAAREDEPRALAPAGCCEAATPASVRALAEPEPGLEPDPSKGTIVCYHRTHASTRKRWESSPAPLL